MFLLNAAQYSYANRCVSLLKNNYKAHYKFLNVYISTLLKNHFSTVLVVRKSTQHL